MPSMFKDLPCAKALSSVRQRVSGRGRGRGARGEGPCGPQHPRSAGGMGRARPRPRPTPDPPKAPVGLAPSSFLPPWLPKASTAPQTYQSSAFCHSTREGRRAQQCLPGRGEGTQPSGEGVCQRPEIPQHPLNRAPAREARAKQTAPGTVPTQGGSGGRRRQSPLHSGTPLTECTGP